MKLEQDEHAAQIARHGVEHGHDEVVLAPHHRQVLRIRRNIRRTLDVSFVQTLAARAAATTKRSRDPNRSHVQERALASGFDAIESSGSDFEHLLSGILDIFSRTNAE